MTTSSTTTEVSRALLAARAQHRALYESLLTSTDPCAVVLASLPGTGKTTTLALLLADLHAGGNWPMVPCGPDGLRPRRVLYLASTIEVVGAFVTSTGGLAIPRLGRQPDANDEFGCRERRRQNALSSLGHDSRPECDGCLARLRASTGVEEPCNYRRNVKRANDAVLVAATAQSFLNNTGAIDRFDVVIVDEAMVSHLLNSITIRRTDLDVWRDTMDTLDATDRVDGGPGRYGPTDPYRRIVNALINAIDLRSSDKGNHVPWPPLMPLLQAKCSDLDDLIRSASVTTVDTQPFEEPQETMIPLRGFRELANAIAAELSRPEGADTRLWLTPEGIRVFLVRDHLVEILRRKVVINLDATPNPLLRYLFPGLRRECADVPEYLHITQATDALGTQRHLRQSSGQGGLRKRLETVIRQQVANARFPAVLCHKDFNPKGGNGRFAFAVDHATLSWGHFGRDERALNTFRHTDLLIIVGRYTPPINELCAEVQALRFASTPPARTGPMKHDLPYRLRVSDGKNPSYTVNGHPDPEVDAYIRWSEAATIIQAIGRGRAVLRSPDAPLRVVLLGALPIADLVIDRLVKLEDLGAAPSQRGRSPATITARHAHHAARHADDLARVEHTISCLRASGARLSKRAIARSAGVSVDTLNAHADLRRVVEDATASDKAAKSDGVRTHKDIPLCDLTPSVLGSPDDGDDITRKTSLYQAQETRKLSVPVASWGVTVSTQRLGSPRAGPIGASLPV